jgi:6-phosphogluconolactonase
MKKLLFNNKKDLDYQLSRDLIGILKSDTDKFGKANILFSGGTTPAGMFSELVKIPFDWSNISIGLVDDRIVPLHHELSNAGMLCNNLLDKLSGPKPIFYPLIKNPKDISSDVDAAWQFSFNIPKPNVVVLGMGNDGHFASLFPNDNASLKGLAIDSSFSITTTKAPAIAKNRISHSWAYLRRANHIILHITGDEKKEIIEASDDRKVKLPIDVLINDKEVNPILYWTSN